MQKAWKTLLIMLLLTVGSLPAYPECLNYEPSVVKVRGKLVIRTLPGPPEYESMEKGDKPETYCFLLLNHHKRCGKSEEAHAVMKEDLAGGTLPSGKFGKNAAWWWIMMLAFNLNTAMKNLVLQDSWAAKRMKALRFSLINLPARVIERSRRLFIRLTKGHPSLEALLTARKRIMELAYLPSG